MKTQAVFFFSRVQAATVFRFTWAGCGRRGPGGEVRSKLALAGLSLALFLECTAPARAGSIVWTNTGGGSWSGSTNWNPNQVPGPSDDAVVTAAGTYTVTLSASVTVGSLTLGGGSGLQTLTNNGNALTLNNPSTVNANGALGWSGGTLSDSNLTVSGTMNWAAGTVAAPLTVAAGGVLNVIGSGEIYVGGTLTNAGTVNWTGGAVYWILMITATTRVQR